MRIFSRQFIREHRKLLWALTPVTSFISVGLITFIQDAALRFGWMGAWGVISTYVFFIAFIYKLFDGIME